MTELLELGLVETVDKEKNLTATTGETEFTYCCFVCRDSRRRLCIPYLFYH